MNGFPLRSADDVVTEGVLGVSALWISVLLHGVFVGLVVAIPLFVPMCALTPPPPPALVRVEMKVVEVEPPKVEEPVPQKVEAPAPQKVARVKKVARKRARVRQAILTKKSSGLLAMLGTTSNGGEIANVFGSGLDADVGDAFGGLIGEDIGVIGGVVGGGGGGLGLRGGGGGGGLAELSARLKTEVVAATGVDRPRARRMLRARRSQVRACLSTGARAEATLEGDRVESADACVARALRGLAFPEGAVVEVHYSR